MNNGNDASSINMSRMLNEFRPGRNSTWPERPERKYTMAVETEITADQVSGGSENGVGIWSSMSNHSRM